MKRFLLLISILIITAATQIHAQGPVAWYMFNGNARDTSGNGKHGLEENMSYAADRFGNTNEAAYFSGLAQISANYKGFPTGNSPRTISLWVNKSGNTAKPPMLVGWGYRGSNLMSSLTLQVHTTPYYWGYADDLSSAGVTVVDSQWYHLVFTYEGGVGKFYINGQLNSSGALSPNTPDTLLWIGNFQTQEEFGNFKGKLDDILIYNRALLPNEIDSLYHDGIPTITSFTPTSGPIGTSVTITGTNFNTTAANNVVYFGGVKASVTNATSASLTVTVPTGATYAPITVTDTTTRLSVASKLPFIVTFSGIRGVTSGSFASKVDFVTGTNPNPLSIGDMDGDSKLDIVAINGGENSVSVFRNTSTTGTISTGSLASRVNFNTGNTPFEVAVGDLDGDGLFDMAIVNPNSGTISLLRNTSTTGSITSGSFAAKVDLMAGNFPNGVAIGDIDGDGKADLAVTNQNSNTVSIFRNISVKGSLSTSSFQTKLDFVTGSTPYGIAIYDLDMDGKRDILFANSGDNSISICRNISTIGNITTGSFLSPINFATGANPQQISVSDIDGDEKPEIIVSHFGGSTISLFQNTSSIGSITSESFAPKIEFTTGTGPYEISIADIDGDSKPDIAVTNFNSNTVSILRNTSSVGSITASTLASKIDFSTGNSPNGVILGDIDGDGRVDVAVSNYGASTISLLKNTTNDLVAYYPFTGGSTADSSGNGNNGTNNGATPTTDRFGNANGAYSFNGTSNYVSTNLDVQPSAIPITSWSAWIYPTRLNYASNQAILSSDDGLADRSLTIRQTTDSIAVYVGGGVEWRPFKLNANQWQHLVVTYKSDNIYVYLNGVKYTYGSAGNILTTVNKLTVGKNPGLSNYFQGNIDDIVIFNRQLSDQEVDSLYHVGNWNSPPVVTSALRDTSLNEDFGKVFIRRLNTVFTDVETSSLSDTAYVLSGSVTALIPSGTDSLYLQSVANYSGTASIRIKATDGSNASVSDTFTVTINAVNDAPIRTAMIPDTTLSEDFMKTFRRKLTAHFTDVDNGTLTYTTTVLSGSVTTSISNDSLFVNSVADYNGSATIKITATDAASASVTDTFVVMIQPVNDPVQKLSALRDTTFIEDTPRHFAIRLSEHFNDMDSPVLTYQAIALDSGIRVFAQHDSLFVEGVPDSNGTKRISVSAGDGETIAKDTVNVSLTPQEDAPRLKLALTDYQMSEDSLSSSKRIAIELKSHFYDPDGDALTFSRNIADGRGGIQTALSNQTDTLFIWNVADSNGTFKIAISADDDKGGQKARDTIILSVSPVNDAPLTSQPVADVFVNENFSKTAIAYLRSTFRDPDGDVLGYGSFTAGGYTDKVTLVTSGDTLYAISKSDSFGVYMGYAKAQD
ncbi:MAG TPA: FG-GAP-like repeat-containing protein, partial [bacterium]|nr:FG-GAP-like repeat-containing protein [bacterium]